MVGDILVLNAGDKIPADGLMVSGSDVTVNESSLTGESDGTYIHSYIYNIYVTFTLCICRLQEGWP